MTSKRPSGRQRPNGKKPPVREVDALNSVIAKLSLLGDFFRHSCDESFLLERDTPLGLYLIVGECIEALKEHCKAMEG